MPKLLKDIFDETSLRSLAESLLAQDRSFDVEQFVADCLADFEPLSLSQRASRIADCMRSHLPDDFARAAAVVLASLGPELASENSFGASPLRYMAHTTFVARYGLDHLETSLALQLELTKRFTAEFSIRAFLVRYPRETYAQLERWSEHPNVHVRRLVSEGTRPRLPWAARLPAFQRDPAPVLALLERLKDDPERYVQRSVANNLNDIAKDHPDRVVALCARWSQEPTKGRSFIVKHALRSLIKQGHRGALGLLGVADKPKVAISKVVATPKRIQLGGALRLAFLLSNVGRREQLLLVDYAVHFVKANGEARPKVFKLRKLKLAAGESTQLELRLSFTDLTTRKHHRGRHRVELLINGERFPLSEFDVR